MAIKERLRQVRDLYLKASYWTVGREYTREGDRIIIKHGKRPALGMRPGEEIEGPGYRLWADQEGNLYEECVDRGILSSRD